MDMNQVHTYARKLLEVHGPQAELEAANRLKQAENGGTAQEIDDWRRIRTAVRERKGAIAS
jgi:hypothetical protein